MIIKTTEKIGGGEITFPTIGYSVKKNFQLSIPEKHYYNQDIQDGIRMGWLEVVMPGVEENEPSNDMVQIVNITGGPLSIGDISLLKGTSTFVTRDKLEITNFKLAIDKGLLEVVDPMKPKVKKTEKPVAKKKKSKKPSTKSKKTENKEDEQEENINPGDDGPKTTMQTWDAHQQKTLKKNESTDVVAEQHNMNIKKEDKKDIQWAKGLTPDDQKSQNKPKKSYKVNSRKTKPQPKRLEAVGEEREKIIDPNATVEFINIPRPKSNKDSIDFVDIEQNSSRISNHPKLSDQNSEVDFE